jgi:hypothetical protein
MVVGDALEYWTPTHYYAFCWKQPLRIFSRAGWGIERDWGGCVWALFLGWFIVGKRARYDA